MTARAVADELIGQMARKWRAVQEKVEKGVLPPEKVIGALQAIHDGRFAEPVQGNAIATAPVLRQRPRLIRGMFTPPEQQLATLRQWMAQRLQTWKDVPEAWFTNLDPAPEWPDGRLQAVVLDLALPDLPESKDVEGNTIPAVPGCIRTVRDLWNIISTQHPNHAKWDQLLLDQEHLFLLDGATYEPGLRWRILDLGANWDKVNGIVPATVRNPITSPNVDGFAVLAHHPRFVRRMDGVKVPYLWIPGFQVAVPGGDPRRRVPIADFFRDERQVNLGAFWDGHRYSHFAVPSRLGVGVRN